MDFGAHTLEHIVLTLEPPERVLREIRGSKELIERQLGQRVTHFAFCNGWYSDEVIRALTENGFESAVTTEDYPNRIGDNPFTLKRKVLWENFSIGLLGKYSGALTACQVDDVFGMLRVNHPVRGRRLQRMPFEGQSGESLPPV
jgi:peptidoglycan/xylan/chitin deacetylase (PgdA/CDA1 family)